MVRRLADICVECFGFVSCDRVILHHNRSMECRATFSLFGFEWASQFRRTSRSTWQRVTGEEIGPILSSMIETKVLERLADVDRLTGGVDAK